MGIMKKEVEFNGVNLTGIKTQDGKIYIVVKTFCEALGIDSSSQLKRIKRDDFFDEGVVIMTIPSESGKQETTLLELDFLPMWLTGIRSDRCKEEIRPYLKEFKLKAKDILADAFFGKRELLLPEQNQERYEPELNEIEDRAARIRKNRDIIRDILVRIAIDYKWIRERAGFGYNKTEHQYRESKKTYFMLDGKGLSIEEIDSMNTDFEKSVLDILNR